MLDVQLIREHPERVRRAIREKGLGDEAVVDRLIALDADRREALTELHEAQARSNTASKEIGSLMQAGRREEAQERIRETGRLKTQIKELEERAREVEEQQDRLILEIPNIPHASVPAGATSAENELHHEWGEKPSFSFDPLPHWELASRSGIIDFERGAKATGAGFPFYIGMGARLQRALINFFIDLATDAGYLEIQAPLMVNAESARGTGQLPDKEGQMYVVSADGLYLIPTAEVPVTNYHRGEILEEGDLPLRYAAYTPCFRREAGSYGKDVRGLNRLHQFDKVELVQLVHPDRSYDALEELLKDAERPLQALELPYRCLTMCAGDMGFTQAKQYDLEVWSAGQERWLEVSSVSNFESFQTRRLAIRYRPAEGRTDFVHSLNGSGLALPRIVAALLENGQQEDGTILLPEALQQYFGADRMSPARS